MTDNMKNVYGAKQASDELSAFKRAIKNENIQMVESILEKGIDLSFTCKNGDSCLHLAVKTGNLDLVKLLIGSIDVNLLNNEENTALHVSVIMNKYDIVLLLLKKQVNVNIRNSVGATPLRIAVIKKDVFLIELLLNYGADPSTKDFTVFCNILGTRQFNLENHLLNLFRDCGIDIDQVFKTLIVCFEILQLQKVLQDLLFDTNRFRNNLDTEEKAINTLLKHSAILSLENLNLFLRNTTIYEGRKYIIDQYNTYCEELAVMKKIKICDKTDTTYYDLLIKRNNALVKCLRCETVKEVLATGNYKTWFKSYASELESNYLQGLQLLQKIDEFQDVLREIFGFIFPYDIICKISEYYNDRDFSKLNVKTRKNKLVNFFSQFRFMKNLKRLTYR